MQTDALQLQGSDNAGVLAAKAALDNAQLNLSYRRVMAEKAGMVTNLGLPPGNGRHLTRHAPVWRRVFRTSLETRLRSDLAFTGCARS